MSRIVENVIHKHKLPFQVGTYLLPLHPKAAVLDVQIQRGNLILWEIHPDDFDAKPTVPRVIIVAFTGVPFGDSSKTYDCIATLQDANGLVWHILEELK